jgi:hypothetical protein
MIQSIFRHGPRLFLQAALATISTPDRHWSLPGESPGSRALCLPSLTVPFSPARWAAVRVGRLPLLLAIHVSAVANFDDGYNQTAVLNLVD